MANLNNRDMSKLNYLAFALVSAPKLWRQYLRSVENRHSFTVSDNLASAVRIIRRELERHDAKFYKTLSGDTEVGETTFYDISERLLKRPEGYARDAGRALSWAYEEIAIERPRRINERWTS